MEWTLEVIAYILLAAVIATVIRKKDTPAEPITKQLVEVAVTFVGALIAAVVATIYADSIGMVMTTWTGFVLIAGAALGGMATVMSFLNIGSEIMARIKPSA